MLRVRFTLPPEANLHEGDVPRRTLLASELFVFAVALLFAFVLNVATQFFTAVTASVLFATQTP